MSHQEGARNAKINRPLSMDVLSLNLGQAKELPVYQQLYRRYRDAIARGKLLPGDRVPSVRSLASELNLPRGTVEAAYQMLISEGYLVARGAAGTVVSPRLLKLAESGSHDALAHIPQAADEL